MSKLAKSGLSMRGGALVLKTISIFLSSRNAKGASTQSAKQPRKSRRMTDKDNKNKISPKLLEAARRDTNFSRIEIEALYKIYRNLISMNRSKPNHDKATASGSVSIIRKPSAVQEGINKTIFCELLHNTFDIVTEDMIMDRIFCIWDSENVGLLTPLAWFAGLSVFLKGTTAQHIDFCFSVYDLNADGFITKDEMFQMLRNCLINHPQDEDPDDGVKDIVEIVMKKLDRDKDGKVSPDDFREAVRQEPLLMETFGTCLPAERAKETFLSTLRS